MTSSIPSKRNYQKCAIDALCLLAVFVLAVAVYGAIPFYSIPVIGQAMWVSAFARSLANDGWLAVFAHNFGYPRPAPMAFGLPGALVQAALLRVTTLRPADAYSFMIIGYLALANLGAIRFAQQLGLRYRMALVASLVWLTAPMVWGHAGYSMLSIGIALLPFYLYQALRVSRIDSIRFTSLAFRTLAFTATSALSVFMDGYTFVMFALATCIVLIFEALSSGRARLKPVLSISLPICAIGFALAYLLYVAFIGHIALKTESLDFFRGWGVDVTMLLFPNKGQFWLWDHIGLGLERNDVFYFGDSSVWMTTFSLLIALFGCIGFYMAKARKHAIALLLIAIIGTYFALGPSLKVHSLRPVADIVAKQFSPLMPASDAVMPTGSGFISEHVPGFRNMRASYRWMALGLFGFWALYALFIAELDRRGRAGLAFAFVALTVICNLPKHGITTPATLAHPELARLKLRAPHHWRESLRDIDTTLLPSFERHVRPNSVVAFVPAGNDFLAGYLAAEAGVKTFNTGGDKNIEIARTAWPTNIQTMFASQPAYLAVAIKQALNAHDTDYVVIPFIDLLWDAHEWPPAEEQVAANRTRFAGVLAQLEADPQLVVSRERYFATIAIR